MKEVRLEVPSEYRSAFLKVEGGETTAFEDKDFTIPISDLSKTLTYRFYVPDEFEKAVVVKTSSLILSSMNFELKLSKIFKDRASRRLRVPGLKRLFVNPIDTIHKQPYEVAVKDEIIDVKDWFEKYAQCFKDPYYLLIDKDVLYVLESSDGTVQGWLFW